MENSIQNFQLATDDEVVKAFLHAELLNDRHNEMYSPHRGIVPNGVTIEQFIEQDNFSVLRSDLLHQARGWPDKFLFEGLPTDIVWQRGIFTDELMSQSLYINYSYWNELSAGTRQPSEAAESIRKNKEAFAISNKVFIDLAREIAQGIELPPIILVCETGQNEFVILEGHQRVTAMALAGRIPDNQQVIIGQSSSMKQWMDEEKS